MELTAEKLTLDNIDKSSWKTYRFDQIAKNISERIEPTQTNLEIYVGLDHIDSDSIHIKRFGKREDVSGTKLRCYPGDVIFGRRRAYQRKAAVVTFDGFCSAHSLILRANPDVILPELFPFFLHSDTFMHLAMDISVGSLSPTVNWGDLKKQEFLLPPKDQQQQIAELLWGGDEMIESYDRAVESINKLKKVIQQAYFENLKADKIKVKDCASVFSGGTPDRKVEEYWNGTIPWVKTGEVNYNVIEDAEEYITHEGLKSSAAKLVKKGAILVAMYGQGVTRGRVAIAGINLTCNQACAVVETNEDYTPEFIYSYLEYKYEDLRSLAHGANQQNLNLNMIKEYSIPNYDLKTQIELNKKFKSINDGFQEIQKNSTSTKSLQKSIINQFF